MNLLKKGDGILAGHQSSHRKAQNDCWGESPINSRKSGAALKKKYCGYPKRQHLIS
jgi:hypothetical protein